MCAARAATHMPVPSLQRRAAVAVAVAETRTHAEGGKQPSRPVTHGLSPLAALHVCAYLRPGPAFPFRRNRPEQGGGATSK